MSVHDALTYLPRTGLQEFKKGNLVYDATRPSDHLYLVLAGRVKISRTASDGTRTLLRIACAEDFFGETSLVPSGRGTGNSAVALELTQVMTWTGDRIAEQIEREPKLALALIEYFGRCNEVHRERIRAAAGYRTGMRLAVALAELAESAGSRTADGTFRVCGLTHQTIGEYVGTTREIVTVEMNRLRRLGLVDYSRRQIDVNCRALRDWMHAQGAAGASAQAASSGTTMQAGG